MLLDLANRAFEHGIALRVLTPLKGPLVQILKNIGVPTAVVPAPELMLHGLEQVNSLGSLVTAVPGLWKWSRRLCKHEYMQDADVVYSTSFKPHLALTLARRHPVVWHLHGFPPQGTEKIWRWLARKVPDAAITNSLAVGHAWSGEQEGKGNGERGSSGKRERRKGKGEKGKATDRLVVVPNGINLDRFRPAEKTFWVHDRLRIPRDHRVIGMPSVFHKWKGQLEVIKAFEQIADEFQDVHLVIVGGSIYDSLAEREFAHELGTEVDRAATGEWQVVTLGSGAGVSGNGLSGKREKGKGNSPGNGERGTGNGIPTSLLPRVHLLPFQSKIENTYPEFDFAVHYSTRPEPFGRVIVEAMGCGIPVIAANEGGPVEILGEGIGERREAGWLAEPRNPTALANTLRSALQLPTDVVRSIGEAGRRRAEDFYSWRRFAAEVTEVLWGVANEFTSGQSR